MSAMSKVHGLALGAGLLSGGCGYGMMGSSMMDTDLATQLLSVNHVGGGMMDTDGQGLGMGQFGMGMGGRWATRSMLGGQSGMMGTGWTHGNGSYGMLFEFTTQ